MSDNSRLKPRELDHESQVEEEAHEETEEEEEKDEVKVQVDAPCLPRMMMDCS